MFLLPLCSAVRKINELVKRVRLAKVHAYIIGYLKEQMPVMMGHAKKQAQVLYVHECIDFFVSFSTVLNYFIRLLILFFIISLFY